MVSSTAGYMGNIPLKVLILAYDFPPYVSVGGIRPFNWYKFLPNYQVHPVVVTRQWQNLYRDHRDYIARGYSGESDIESSPDHTLIKTPYTENLANRLLLKHGPSKFSFWRKLISFYYEIAQFIFHTGPKAELIKASEKYLEENKVDVIIATGDPFVLFKYASELSRKYSIPWVADYRDAWTHDPTKKNNFLKTRWNSFWEKRIVSTASAIISVSSFIEEHTFQIVPRKKSYVLANGYDPDAVKSAAASEQQNGEALCIGYTGTIPDWAPWQGFLEVIRDFVKKRGASSIRLNFYGINKEQEVKDFVTKNPVMSEVIVVHPKIPNDKLLMEFSRNNVFLLFNYYSMMGTKIYECIALKRKILLCYSEDEESRILKQNFYHISDFDSGNHALQEELIRSTHSGITVKDKVQLGEVLEELYGEFKSSGHISCNPVNFEEFSRESQARKLAEILRQVSESRKSESKPE